LRRLDCGFRRPWAPSRRHEEICSSAAPCFLAPAPATATVDYFFVMLQHTISIINSARLRLIDNLNAIDGAVALCQRIKLHATGTCRVYRDEVPDGKLGRFPSASVDLSTGGSDGRISSRIGVWGLFLAFR